MRHGGDRIHVVCNMNINKAELQKRVFFIICCAWWCTLPYYIYVGFFWNDYCPYNDRNFVSQILRDEGQSLLKPRQSGILWLWTWYALVWTGVATSKNTGNLSLLHLSDLTLLEWYKTVWNIILVVLFMSQRDMYHFLTMGIFLTFIYATPIYMCDSWNFVRISYILYSMSVVTILDASSY